MNDIRPTIVETGAPALASVEVSRRRYLLRRITVVAAAIVVLLASAAAATGRVPSVVPGASDRPTLDEQPGATAEAPATGEAPAASTDGAWPDDEVWPDGGAATPSGDSDTAPGVATPPDGDGAPTGSASDEETLAYGPAAEIPAGAARFVAQEPVRVVDTREGDGAPPAETPLAFTVDDDLTAVVLSVSVMNASREGSVLIDGRDGVVEAVRLPAPGATTTNLVIVPLEGAKASVRSSAGGHLVVDVVGGFEAVDDQVAAGRLVPVAPTRVAELVTAVDGRELAIGRSAAGAADVDLGEASAVLAVVTADVGPDGGIVRLGPEDGRYDQMLMWAPAPADNRTRHGLVLLTPSDELLTSLRYDGGAELTLDIVGYFTSDAAPADTAGLFVASGPRVVFDGPVDGGSTTAVGGLGAETATALVTLGPRVGVPGQLGSALVAVDGGWIDVGAPTDVEVVVTLLGEFL